MKLNIDNIVKINQALAENETVLVEKIIDVDLNVSRLYEITNITLDGVSCVVEYRGFYDTVDYEFDVDEVVAVYKAVGIGQTKLFDLFW